MYTFKELPGAEFASLAAVLEHAATAQAIEQAIALFEVDGDTDALLTELQALSFTPKEIAAIIATGGERPPAAYYAAGDQTPDISTRRRGRRGRLVMTVDPHAY